ncbi:MAG: 3-oxoacyl-ACP reductase FabG [Lachnospiraceae bacterium]|nr:3-oxoacyl-ACP reductase FabG [Lachnospiraceae bacterium]
MLTGKTAIITGGSRGIGAAIARKFASLGANIAVIYAGNQEAAAAVCAECEAQGVKAAAYQCNVADFEEAKAVTAQVKKEFGGIHILVNSAGITKDGLMPMMSEAAWDGVLDTNLKGTFNMIRHASGAMIRAKEGCILNITSVSGLMGNAGQCNYAASKAGVVGLTKSVAKELAARGIRCNAIAPGFIRTDMTAGQTDNPMLSMIPLGRMGEAEEIAEAAAYLAEARYVTGEVLRVDGGIAM